MKIEPVLQWAIAAGVVALAVVYLGRRAGAVAGGIVSGNNALTEGTTYAGAGVVGTLGAATNAASGGVLQSAGEAIGGWFYDLTHPRVNPVILDAWGNLTGGSK
jgi:hypothetical protein